MRTAVFCQMFVTGAVVVIGAVQNGPACTCTDPTEKRFAGRVESGQCQCQCNLLITSAPWLYNLKTGSRLGFKRWRQVHFLQHLVEEVTLDPPTDGRVVVSKRTGNNSNGCHKLVILLLTLPQTTNSLTKYCWSPWKNIIASHQRHGNLND